MSVVKINVLTVPAAAAATLEQRFAGRAGAVEGAEGFARWQSGQDFARGHATATDRGERPPAAQGSEICGFEVVQSAAPADRR